MKYRYGILECDLSDDDERWIISYADSDEQEIIPDFQLSRINLLTAMQEAEGLGWELVQVFKDSTTNFLSYGYAVVRKKI